MAAETVLTQTTYEPRSVSRSKASLLPVCCICQLVLDETGPSLGQEQWVTQGTYQKTHGALPPDSLLTHTYCPPCFRRVMERIHEWQEGLSSS
jgi:hypothetical protein